MANHSDSPSEVVIGAVSGGISHSMIAGRDIHNATMTIAGQRVPADKAPTLDDLKQLLADIQGELEDISTQQERLKAISSATPFVVQGVVESVKDAASTVSVTAPPGPHAVQSAQAKLREATTLLTGILDNAKTVAEKTLSTGAAITPLLEKLAPLAEKMAVAAVWAAKLLGLG